MTRKKPAKPANETVVLNTMSDEQLHLFRGTEGQLVGVGVNGFGGTIFLTGAGTKALVLALRDEWVWTDKHPFSGKEKTP